MELERRVRQMHAEGQNPQGIQSWIQQQLLPLANATKVQLQAEVNHAQQAVGNCASQLASAEDGAREQETTLSIGESRHNECELQMSQTSKRAQDDCAGVQGLIDILVAPPSVASVDVNSTEAVEDALQANFHFFQEQYPKYMDEDTHCSTATSLAEQQEQQCDADKANLESSYCSLRSARQQICADYDACFAEQTALFNRVVGDVKAVEAHTKSSFQTLTCFSHTIMTDMENQRPTCNASGVDTTYLDVFYPSQPSKESCSDEVSTSWNYSAALCEEQVGGAEEVAGAGTGAAVTSGNASGNVSNVNASLFVVKDEKAASATHTMADDKKGKSSNSGGNHAADSKAHTL
jgi:hypothetical protein